MGSFFYVLLLGLAVSIDAFAAGASYGIKCIKIPLKSLTIIGIITLICTSLAMYLATYPVHFLDTNYIIIIGSFLLIIIGIINIIKTYQDKISDKSIRFDDTQSNKYSVIKIFNDPRYADVDNSKSISSLEAVFLALALGMDNLVATFASNMLHQLPLYTPIVMAIIQVLLLFLGIHLSTAFLPEKIKARLPYLAGIILIFLGLYKIIF